MTSSLRGMFTSVPPVFPGLPFPKPWAPSILLGRRTGRVLSWHFSLALPWLLWAIPDAPHNLLSQHWWEVHPKGI